jgi:hypothetical protein
MKAIIGITSTAILSLFLGISAPAYAQQEEHGEKKDHQQENKQEHAKPEQKHAQEQGQGDHKQQQPSHAQQQQQPAQAQRQSQNDQHQNEQDRNKQQRQGQRQKSEEKQQPQRAEQQPRQDQNRQEHAQQQPAQEQPQHAQHQHQQRQVSPEQQRVQQTAWQQHRSERWESDHRTWQQRGGYSGYRIPEDRFRGYFGPDHGFRIYGRPFLVVGGFPRFQYRGYWFSLVDPWPQYWSNNWYDTDDVYVSYVDNGYYLFNRSHPDVGIAISISL